MTAETGTRPFRAQGYDLQLVTEGAIEQAENIWALAFGSNWARDFARKDLTRIYGAFKGNDLHAVVGVVDFDMHFAGKWVACGGIGAVATMPGQRYQNLINMLIDESLRDLHGKGVPFSALYPFSYPFYERMGWACTHNTYWIELGELQWLKAFAKRGDARQWRLLSGKERDQILPVQERFAGRFNLSLRRSLQRNDALLNYPGKLWQVFSHPDGYMIWDMGSSDDKLAVTEFVYCDEQAFFDGLALIAQMEGQGFRRVQWTDWQFEHMLKNGVPYPRPNICIAPSMMTRVVNLEAFAALLPEALEGLRVADPLSVTAPASGGNIGPGELVQLVTGYFSTPDARFPADLHALVADRPCFTREQF